MVAADALISNGETDKAIKVLENMLKKEPENEKVKVMLAKLLVFKDKEKCLSLIEGIDEGSENFELVVSLKTISRLINLKNNPNGLQESPAWNLYMEAIGDIQKQNFDSALDKFIEVIRSDRTLDDDGARKACIAIFKYLGEENEITIKHRRDFGSALYI